MEMLPQNKRFVLLVSCVIFVFLTVMPASAAIAPTLYSATINKASGEVPVEVVFQLETGASARGMKVLDDLGNDLFAAVSFETNNSGNKVWTLIATIAKPYTGAYTCYARVGDDDWLAMDATYNVSYSQGSRPEVKIVPVSDIGTLPQVSDAWDKTQFYGTALSTTHCSDERISSRTGPDHSYTDGGSYKTNKISSIVGLYTEKIAGSPWIYTELSYTSGYYRRLYFRLENFTSVAGVPHAEFEGVAATLNESSIPAYGPGPLYDNYKEATMPKGTKLTVLHEENDYLFVEYNCSHGKVRAWVERDRVDID